jgi:hypothetical protein
VTNRAGAEPLRAGTRSWPTSPRAVRSHEEADASGARQLTQQQTGVPPIIMQQVQPDFMHPIRQSQHAWIMSQHALSPLVQVMVHPLAVISHLHIAIVMLQLHTTMPFIVQHIEHIPPAIIAQRFCIIVHAAGSSHVHVTFIPPAHFSTFITQWGTITMFGAIGIVGVPVGMFPIPVIAERSIISAVVIIGLLREGTENNGAIPSASRRWVSPTFRAFPRVANRKADKSPVGRLLSSAARLELQQNTRLS